MYYLDSVSISIFKLDHIAVNFDLIVNFLKEGLFAVLKRPSLKIGWDRLKNASKIGGLWPELSVTIASNNVNIQLSSSAFSHLKDNFNFNNV